MSEGRGRDQLMELIRREAKRGTPPEDTLKMVRLLVAQDPSLLPIGSSDYPARPPARTAESDA